MRFNKTATTGGGAGPRRAVHPHGEPEEGRRGDLPGLGPVCLDIRLRLGFGVVHQLGCRFVPQ